MTGMSELLAKGTPRVSPSCALRPEGAVSHTPPPLHRRMATALGKRQSSEAREHARRCYDQGPQFGAHGVHGGHSAELTGFMGATARNSRL